MVVNFQELARPYKNEFSEQDIQHYIEVFKKFDKDGNGSIDVQELESITSDLGEKIPHVELQAQINEVDHDGNGAIEFGEFLEVIKHLKKGKHSAFSQHVVTRLATATGTHSFSEEEKVSFAEHMNSVLSGDAVADARLPINPNNMDLFEKVKDGILLCKLINYAVPDTIDERALNTKTGMNKYQMTENGNIVVNSAKAIGCSVVNIGANDINAGTEHLILGLVWQILRIGLLSQISLAHHPELFRLLEPGESIEDLLKLPAEQILLRWFNYHLKKAGHSRKVTNFSGDIKDSECYTILLNQLAPAQCDKSPLETSDPQERAKRLLDQAEKINCRKFVKPNDIVKGNPKLNLAFVANLFNTIPGLEPLTEEEKAGLDAFLFNSEGTREARCFALWINSLGIDPFVNNLFQDLRDGLVILRVLDKINPGCVDWKKVNEKVPMIKFKQVENCNYAVNIAKDMKFSLVGIGGTDIHDGNQTLTLALVWQMMRYNVMSILKSLSNRTGRDITDSELVKMANDRVKTSGKNSRMESFQDKSLTDSIFFLDLLNSIRNCVDYNLVHRGSISEEEKLLNAKYTISITRKLGGCIFLLPEDIVEVKSKMILTLIASILSVAQQQQH
ncbi:actin binding protein [Heterostelium album PN500]|uniref:Fimbrin n=1 Tax=Heterostelium pallidum (strain ATCC 26659 / Pp 5 / PN500) TaxID=670386 RepID=D3BGE1_HETP5|nr:actin binding protein [Heterostelium album PN500]EFA79541.1 actin binding protein [Heterostelium album PN500]|eukprot:XP_020431662.1 actin binding protein [Heterostelium album PN500]